MHKNNKDLNLFEIYLANFWMIHKHIKFVQFLYQKKLYYEQQDLIELWNNQNFRMITIIVISQF